MFLQLQGEDDTVVDALREGDLDGTALATTERELLKFAELLTLHSYRCGPDDIQRLRDVGWTDPQIAEAVYVTAMFAFFNRVADAFGLDDPQYELVGNVQRDS